MCAVGYVVVSGVHGCVGGAWVPHPPSFSDVHFKVIVKVAIRVVGYGLVIVNVKSPRDAPAPKCAASPRFTQTLKLNLGGLAPTSLRDLTHSTAPVLYRYLPR